MVKIYRQRQTRQLLHNNMNRIIADFIEGIFATMLIKLLKIQVKLEGDVYRIYLEIDKNLLDKTVKTIKTYFNTGSN